MWGRMVQGGELRESKSSGKKSSLGECLGVDESVCSDVMFKSLVSSLSASLVLSESESGSRECEANEQGEEAYRGLMVLKRSWAGR